MLVSVALALALWLLPTLACGQDVPPPVGMSSAAFKFALAGQVADLVTTEAAIAAGAAESNPLVRHRAVRVGVKLALPLTARWLYRALKIPREAANASAISMGAWGFGPAGWNVYMTVKLANR